MPEKVNEYTRPLEQINGAGLNERTKAELLLAENELEKNAQKPGLGITIEKHVSVNQDFIVLGAPTAGQIKVYGDAARPQTWAHKIEVTQRILAEAKERNRAPVGEKNGGA